MNSRRSETKEEAAMEAEEEEGGGVLAGIHKLGIETAETDEEAAEGLEATVGISTQEMEVKGDRGS